MPLMLSCQPKRCQHSQGSGGACQGKGCPQLSLHKVIVVIHEAICVLPGFWILACAGMTIALHDGRLQNLVPAGIKRGRGMVAILVTNR